VVILVPGVSGAWPWDDNRDITVQGDITCKGFDVGSDVPFYPYARVEGFEIRGRSNVAQISLSGWAASYRTAVPPGWQIEYSIKCSNSSRWIPGSFDVKKSTVGSSYNQTRHVCTSDGSLVEVCGSRDLGKCFEVLITRGFSSQLTIAKQFKILFNKFGDSLGATPAECAQAISDSTPNLSQPTVPGAQPTIPTLPESNLQPQKPIDPIQPAEPKNNNPELPPVERPPVQSPPVQQPPVPTTATGTVNGCNTYGQNCDGNPIYVNVPQPGYNYKTEPKVEAVANGSRLTARCWTTGATVYNWAKSQNDPGPNPYDSDVHFSVQAPNGTWGYIPDTYFVRDKGNKLGLPHC